MKNIAKINGILWFFLLTRQKMKKEKWKDVNEICKLLEQFFHPKFIGLWYWNILSCRWCHDIGHQLEAIHVSEVTYKEAGLVYLSALENRKMSIAFLNVIIQNFLICSVCLPPISILLSSTLFIASVARKIKETNRLESDIFKLC